jgi:hypothetical protein
MTNKCLRFAMEQGVDAVSQSFAEPLSVVVFERRGK